MTDSCICDSGYDGAACDICASGYAGYPDCVILNQECTNWTRDISFDSNTMLTASGIWGSSSDDIYVTVTSSTQGMVEHWIGGWLLESLPTHVNGTATFPERAYAIWGLSSNDAWATANGKSGTQAMLFHKATFINGWTEDDTEPAAMFFNSIWGADSSNIFLLGKQTSGYRVWRKAVSGWNDMSAPSPGAHGAFTQVWGLDASHVFVSGYADSNGDGNPDGGILLYWNGSAWNSLTVPSGCIELNGVHGTSLGEIWATGVNSSGQGVIYSITSNLTTWTPFVSSTVTWYGPIWSTQNGRSLAGGDQGATATAGIMRLTSIIQGAASTSSVDAKAYWPAAFWFDSASNTMHAVTNSPPQAGHYTGLCN